MTDAGRSRTQWLNRPLSRRYGWVLIDVASVRLRDAEGLHDHRVRWAFGWLADGECEALGAWMDREGGSDEAGRLLMDLRARGLERMWHAWGPGLGTGQEQERAPQSPGLEADQVREALTRAIRRRGSFESADAVLDFMAGALQRAERRLDRERLVARGRPRLESGAQMASPGI